MNEIVAQDTELVHGIGFTDEISWIAPPNLTFDEYIAISRTFQQIQQSLAFWYGDLLNFGEDAFGEEFAQAIPEMSRSAETLLKYKSTARRVPREIRQKSLGWSHHFYVAYIPIEQRGPLLEIAANVGLSSRELKDVVKLTDELRADFILAVQHYTNEVGPMTREVFFPLLNRFRLGDVEDNPANDDEEDEEDGEDEEGEPQEDRSEEVAEDDLLDFWENAGVPIALYGKQSVFWEGISVRATVDNKGRPYLVWEQMT